MRTQFQCNCKEISESNHGRYSKYILVKGFDHVPCMFTCDINLPIPPERLHRTSCGASDISATIHVMVAAWPDITFLSVPVIAGGGCVISSIIKVLILVIIILTV